MCIRDSIYTVCLGARSALAATAVYVMLEGLFYGFGDWWLAYCWAWPLWVDVYKRQSKGRYWPVVCLLRRSKRWMCRRCWHRIFNA